MGVDEPFILSDLNILKVTLYHSSTSGEYCEKILKVKLSLD